DEVEQDKKKRNTLASARFRVKKKLKEQEMERNVKLLSDRVATFNERINQLELENACLKSLILEKNEKKSNDLLRSIKEKSL
ncbi:Met28p CYBJADRAFT_113831, partial [Cyberlindnera jadinii NRRL Y-1542]